LSLNLIAQGKGVSCVLATEGRTWGAWQIREPGPPCSQRSKELKLEVLLTFQARRLQYDVMKVDFI